MLKNYLYDGADFQARAVLMLLQGICHEDVKVGRWENCREQGYVVSRGHDPQVNVAFFTHRNSDQLCAVKWQQSSVNTLNIRTANFGDTYLDKWDVSHSVGYGQIQEMAEWINKQL